MKQLNRLYERVQLREAVDFGDKTSELNSILTKVGKKYGLEVKSQPSSRKIKSIMTTKDRKGLTVSQKSIWKQKSQDNIGIGDGKAEYKNSFEILYRFSPVEDRIKFNDLEKQLEKKLDYYVSINK
jgi:hypothetical protein